MDSSQVGTVSSIPPWLEIILGEKFFRPCIVHESAKKNEKNIFCLDCCTSVCLHCLPIHQAHRILQIRRYVYHDVMRLCDAQKLMNCSLVQPYTTNSAKVVFLHKRPTSRPMRSNGGNFCMKCDRNLQDSYLFCSLHCKSLLQTLLLPKIHHLVTSKRGSIIEQIDKSLPDKPSTSLSSPELRDGQMAPHLVLDLPVSQRTCFGSTSGSAANSCSIVSRGTLACGAIASATIEFEKKKKRSALPANGISCQKKCSTINRRKSVPHRAPLN